METCEPWSYHKDKLKKLEWQQRIYRMNFLQHHHLGTLQWDAVQMALVGNVLDMSLERGHVLKSLWQNWMTSHILCIFLFKCLEHVLRVSHMSSLPPRTKNLQINQIFQIYIQKINLIPLINLNFTKSLFGITKQILILKWKVEVTRKDFLPKHKKWITSQISSPSPFCPSWSWQKLIFFHFFISWQKLYHKTILGQRVHQIFFI